MHLYEYIHIVRRMYETVILWLDENRDQWADICQQLKVDRSWIQRVVSRGINDPGVKKIEFIYTEYVNQ